MGKLDAWRPVGGLATPGYYWCFVDEAIKVVELQTDGEIQDWNGSHHTVAQFPYQSAQFLPLEPPLAPAVMAEEGSSGNTWYTVVGFYEDNHQPYLEHVLAPDPVTACLACQARVIRDNESGLAIVDVFEGRINTALPQLSEVISDTGMLLDQIVDRCTFASDEGPKRHKTQ